MRTSTLAAVAGSLAFVGAAWAQSHTTLRLEAGSSLTLQNCDACGCSGGPASPVVVPLEGRFVLNRQRMGALGEWFRFMQISWAGRTGDRPLRLEQDSEEWSLYVRQGVAGLGNQSASFILLLGGARLPDLTGTSTIPSVLPSIDVVVTGSDAGNCTAYTLVVKGEPICVADYDDGTQRGAPDGAVSIDDLLYYVTLWSEGSVLADVDDGSGTGTIDEGLDISDLLFYIERFAAGC